MSLDTVTTGTDPIDLANLAVTSTAAGPPPNATWYTGYPLPVSGALTSGIYSPASGAGGSGYWVTKNSPIITGCIKVEIQGAGGGWTDITKTILNLGISGRNIDPAGTGVNAYPYVAPPNISLLPSSSVGATKEVPAQGPTTNPNVGATVGCTDPSPNAILRIARLRDNVSAGAGCGGPSTNGIDYWPMVLYDTREGVYRPGNAPAAPNSLDYAGANAVNGVTGVGVMNYIELDAGNLATWLKNNQAGLGINNNTGFTVYFSDRRGEQPDPSSGNVKTGSFGYNDFVNASNAATGCPNGPLPPTPGIPEQGEDLEGDGILRTYGGLSITPANVLTGMGAGPFQPNCGSINWPGYVYNYTQEGRENQQTIFRRALKLVDGATLNLGTSCYGAAPNPPCGSYDRLREPVYIQGDYNTNTNTPFRYWLERGSVRRGQTR